MSQSTKLPRGMHSVSPHLVCAGAADAIEFYKKAFGAQETYRLAQPDGRVGHAELSVGDSVVMLADEFPEMGIKGPASYGGSPVSLLLYVADVDAAAARAVAAGATVKRPVKDQFYGDRSGTFEDPFGHNWSVATHIREMTEQELHEAMRKARAEHPACAG